MYVTVKNEWHQSWESFWAQEWRGLAWVIYQRDSGCCVAAIRGKNANRLNHCVDGRTAEKWLDSEYILELVPIVFVNGLHMRYKKKDESKIGLVVSDVCLLSFEFSRAVSPSIVSEQVAEKKKHTAGNLEHLFLHVSVGPCSALRKPCLDTGPCLPENHRFLGWCSPSLSQSLLLY